MRDIIPAFFIILGSEAYIYFMKKCIKLSAYLLGAIIGAGFVSGKEIVAFLGKDGLNVYSAALCAVAVFLSCFVFLKAGNIVKGGNFGRCNAIMFPEIHGFFDVCVILNGLILLSAMVAAITETGNRILPLGHLYSLIALTAVVSIARKGRARVMNGSFVMMFFIVAIIIAVSVENYSSGEDITEGRVRVLPCLFYVAMNMLLSSGVMLSETELDTKSCAVVAAIVAVVMGTLIFTLGYAIRCAGCENSNMPIFELSARLGKVAYCFSVLLVFLSVTTTMITVMTEISTFLSDYTDKTFAMIATAAVSFVLSLFGFEKVVESFYPIIGAAGVVYFLLTLKYLAPFAFNVLFRNGNDKVHERGKKTKNDR